METHIDASALSDDEINSIDPNFFTEDDSKKNFIKNNLINTMFPVLLDQDRITLLEGLILIIDTIYRKFNIYALKNNKNLFWNQLIQNDLLDLRALVGLMLPYIKDEGDDRNKHSLHSLKDLYTEKIPDTDKYKFSNMQYNRCIRYQRDGQIRIKDRPLETIYFENHLQLLLSSINTMSNKLYVNWMDVLPVTIDTYSQNLIYKITKYNIQHKSSNVADLGLNFSDFYNVISNHLYHEIVNYKWLIYEFKIVSDHVPIISYLESTDAFEFDNLWRGVLWSQLTDTGRFRFTSDWNKLLKSYEQFDNYAIYYIHIFFCKYSVSKKRLEKEKKLRCGSAVVEEGEDVEDVEDNGSINISDENIRNAIDGIANVPAEYIYAFLLDQLLGFKRSWFYYFIKIKKSKYFQTTDEKIKITPKNVYNYAKLITRKPTENELTGTSKLLDLPRFWISLKKNDQEEVMAKMKNTHPNEMWFNVSRYLRNFYDTEDTNLLMQYNILIRNTVHDNLIDIVFESLIYHGLLSQFVPNAMVTDNVALVTRIGTNADAAKTNEKRSQMKNTVFKDADKKRYKDHAYYYITGNKYAELPNTIYDDKKKSFIHFFDALTSIQGWQFRYAMNWVSQINFYHHYANVRVMYATGGTGTGKSTIIPRLIMYSQHMLDYKITGKIICTQPRISPTVNSGEMISSESGIPIISYDEKYKQNMPTSEYYIQYKHAGGSHVDVNAMSFLRIVTDGTLMAEMKNSPFMTKTLPVTGLFDKNKTPIDWMKTYTADNKYDILIIDEAHEHNANMDLILTLARDACYVNNSLKLVIISATMDDDEPIYRRYYRTINDNRMFPLSQEIIANKLDRANMDRRVDISVPRSTTQFKIDDIFLPKEASDKINDKNFVEAGIAMTIKVVNETTSGDILLFMTGKKDIDQSVAEINARTPSNVIAFPFIGRDLSEEQRNFILKIDKMLKTYTRQKSDVSKSEDEITQRVDPGTYNRAIIIATNVAEASITIDSLRYVVDTGYAKVDVYDPLLGVTKLITMPISNTSSMQRRGRVGRVAAGSVYYMYDKEKVANNKTAYKIADTNIRDLIVDLLRTEQMDHPIVDRINDINRIRNIRNIEIPAELGNPGVYGDIITKLYMYGESTLNDTGIYKYYGLGNSDVTIDQILTDEYLLTNHDDYHFDYIFESKCHTGYDDSILEDRYLDFYIIHPDENIITRNMYTGKYIFLKQNQGITEDYYYYFYVRNDVNRTDTGLEHKTINWKDVILPKYELMIRDAKLLAKIVEIAYDQTQHPSLALEKFDSDYERRRSLSEYYARLNEILRETKKTILLTTKIGKKTGELQRVLDMGITNNPQNILWYMYSLPYDVQNDVVGMMSLLSSTDDIKKWAVTKNIRDVERFIRRGITIRNSKSFPSDLNFIWKIWLQIKKIFNDNQLYQYVTIDKDMESRFRISVKNYLQGNKMNIDEYKVLNTMYRSGKLNVVDEFYHYVSNLKIDFEERLKTTNIAMYVKIVADMFKINEQIIQKFVVVYLESMLQINKKQWCYQYDIEHNVENSDVSKEDVVEWVKTLILPRVISDGSDTYLIMLESYLRAYANNLICAESKGKYISLSNGAKIITKFWSKKILIRQTFQLDPSEFFVYHSNNALGDIITVFYLTPVIIDWVFKLNPIYYYYFLFDDGLNKYFKEDESLEILKKRLAEKYDVNYLMNYVKLLGDPNLLFAIMIHINTTHIKKNFLN